MIKRYTDFLKDRQFIRWQLSPDEELDAHWNEDIQPVTEDDSLSFQNDVQMEFDESGKENQIFITHKPF